MKKLLFTDLDGTLLDYHTYSCESVRTSVEHLKAADVSIIFCSSKTWKEQEQYLITLGLDEPAIVENGSGIFFPSNSKDLDMSDYQVVNREGHPAIVLGNTYDHVLEAVSESAKKYYPGLKYYAKLSVAEISEITMLEPDSAQKAKTRDFSETIFNADMTSDEFAQFKKAVNAMGFQCIPGSKYITITGKDTDKGRAVQILVNIFKRKYGDVTSFGAGDSMNDLAMLKVVDYPYLVQRPDKTWTDIQLNKLTKVAAVGPTGWNIMAEEILI